ncbi:Zn-dependent hydrolase [Sporolactobacillus sp. STCC-11]|uniref:Zn-dependent hydrolase n=1 Tax=Sporolactobacillus caesalpiniae TaxID=3230362 RepID=UPI00339A04DA
MGKLMTKNLSPIFINKERLIRRFHQLEKYGLNRHGGIDRSLGSDSDIHTRKWLVEEWEKAFSEKAFIDPVANLWIGVRGKQNLPPLVMGSHHDAVPNGGKFDGAVGVLLATEVMQTIGESGLSLRHPLKIVSFSAEEPNPYNVSTLGSRTITGKLTKEDILRSYHDKTHEPLSDTLKRLGGNIDYLENHVLHPHDFSAFLECHIEQGRHLYDNRRSLAVVSNITGIYREKIQIIGEANHAGTTLMNNRHDALLAGSELSLSLEKIINNAGYPNTVATIGKFDVSPNSANIIPGEVNLIAEIRTSDRATLENLLSSLTEDVSSIEKKRKVIIRRTSILDQNAVPMDEKIKETLRYVMNSLSIPFMDLPSMAGHDSVHMASIAKTGMIFVPSINGKSHCPEEKTDFSDIEKAGNVLIQTILRLDKELD